MISCYVLLFFFLQQSFFFLIYTIKNKKIRNSKIPLRGEWRGRFSTYHATSFHTCLGRRVSEVKTIFSVPVTSLSSAVVEGRNWDNRHLISHTHVIGIVLLGDYWKKFFFYLQTSTTQAMDREICKVSNWDSAVLTDSKTRVWDFFVSWDQTLVMLGSSKDNKVYVVCSINARWFKRPVTIRLASMDICSISFQIQYFKNIAVAQN